VKDLNKSEKDTLCITAVIEDDWLQYFKTLDTYWWWKYKMD